MAVGGELGYSAAPRFRVVPRSNSKEYRLFDVSTLWWYNMLKELGDRPRSVGDGYDSCLASQYEVPCLVSQSSCRRGPLQGFLKGPWRLWLLATNCLS